MPPEFAWSGDVTADLRQKLLTGPYVSPAMRSLHAVAMDTDGNVWAQWAKGCQWVKSTDATLIAANALLSEVTRLQSGGCARDQRTTQFCAEAVAKDVEIRRLTSELVAANDAFTELSENMRLTMGTIENMKEVLAAVQTECARLRAPLDNALMGKWFPLKFTHPDVQIGWIATTGEYRSRVALEGQEAECFWPDEPLPGWKLWREGHGFVASGPETGHAGQVAAVAAYRRAIGLPCP